MSDGEDVATSGRYKVISTFTPSVFTATIIRIPFISGTGDVSDLPWTLRTDHRILGSQL